MCSALTGDRHASCRRGRDVWCGCPGVRRSSFICASCTCLRSARSCLRARSSKSRKASPSPRRTPRRSESSSGPPGRCARPARVGAARRSLHDPPPAVVRPNPQSEVGRTAQPMEIVEVSPCDLDGLQGLGQLAHGDHGRVVHTVGRRCARSGWVMVISLRESAPSRTPLELGLHQRSSEPSCDFFALTQRSRCPNEAPRVLRRSYTIAALG